ncbi:MAG TPA: hypothetical protein DD640_10215 [Clostridiales bacterium]|nr:hypothetical protein [Clostridiales bacterium]
MNDGEHQQATNTDICLWLDFYGRLLTEHTREILELRYCEDLSLSEIAENLHISRQAVNDRIRRGVQNLAGYETKLGLASRYRIEKESVSQALQAIETGQAGQAREKLLQLSRLL